MLKTNGYTPVESNPVLADGIYKMRIANVEEKHFPSGDGYFDITVQIYNHPGATPNKIMINEAPTVGAIKSNGNPVTEDDHTRWCREFTRFFDCFGIPRGNWATNNWINKEGYCKVAPQYDANEPDKKSKKYKAIFPQAPEKAATVENTTAAPQGESPEIPVF